MKQNFTIQLKLETECAETIDAVFVHKWLEEIFLGCDLGKVTIPAVYPDSVLTAQELAQYAARSVIAIGFVKDDPTGANMTGTGKSLKFVAAKGAVNDWAIYVHWADSTDDFVLRQGDKVTNIEHIRNCVPCDDTALALYRK